MNSRIQHQPNPDRDFDAAIRFTLPHEGGFVDDPDDPGGPTNYGISLRFAEQRGDLDADGDGWPDLDIDRDGDIDAADIAGLTREAAAAVYYEAFWRPTKLRLIAAAPIRIKLFDFSVNMGPRAAVKLLQQACVCCGRAVTVDGVLGEQTLGAVNDLTRYYLILYTAFQSEAAGRYRAIAAGRPASRKYLSGWLRRAYAPAGQAADYLR